MRVSMRAKRSSFLLFSFFGACTHTHTLARAHTHTHISSLFHTHTRTHTHTTHTHTHITSSQPARSECTGLMIFFLSVCAYVLYFFYIFYIYPHCLFSIFFLLSQPARSEYTGVVVSICVSPPSLLLNSSRCPVCVTNTHSRAQRARASERASERAREREKEREKERERERKRERERERDYFFCLYFSNLLT
jgi:hypothetical protein